jgi:DNA polymerase-3 subunit alpha
VKNVGRNLIDNVVAARADKPYASLYDFCKRMRGNELNRRAVESLIKAGAFDSLGVNRHSLVEAVEGILKSIESDARHNLDGQIDLFSCMGMGMGDAEAPEQDTYEVKPLPEYSAMELLQMEKEVSGLYLSGHPLDAYRDETRRFATHSIKALTGEDAAKLDNTSVRIVCTIVKSRMMTTKSNSVMAFTSVEDLTGTMEVIVFPRVLDNYRPALQDNAAVVIEGRLSVREDEPAKLMAEMIVPVEQYHPGNAPARGGAERGGAPRQNAAQNAPQPRLYIRLPSKSSVQYEKVLNLLELFDGGQMPVVLYLEDTRQKLGVPSRLYTTGHPLLMAELERLLGKANVATK